LKKFYLAMDDDFNTAGAFAVIFDLTRELNKAIDQTDRDSAGRLSQTLLHFGKVLGLLKLDPKHFLGMDAVADGNTNQVVGSGELTVLDINTLIAHRNQAKVEKNFDRADNIREQLRENGILIEDTSDGKTTWRER